MRAVRMAGGVPALMNIEEPSGDWPLLQVRSAGICGSDLTLLPSGLPVTVGHEIAGTFDGKRYCVEPTVRCGVCDQCLVGATQRCRGTAPHGLLGVNFDGGLADQVRVPTECLVPLPEGLPIEDAALVEPLAVCCHALRRVSVSPGDRVLVVGGGSIGLLAVAAARALGLDVDLAARHPHQTEAGHRLGAGTPAGEYDVVVESAGTESSLATCVERVAPGGRVAVVGVSAAARPIADIAFMMKEISVVACTCYGHGDHGRDFTQAAGIIAANPQIAATVITHRFPLADAAEAFRVAADRAVGSIKVVLQP